MIAEIINDIHALVAATVKAEQERIVGILNESIKESEAMAGIAYPAKIKNVIAKIEGK